MPDRVKNIQSDRLFAFWQFFRPRACARAALSAHHFSLPLSRHYLSGFLSVFIALPLARAHARTEAHTHTSVSLDIFQLFHPALLYLHALSLSKVTTFVFMSYPSARTCVCVCGTWSLFLSISHTHTHTHQYLSMPPGSWTQLSVSLILSPHLPYSCSSSPSLLAPHPFFFSFPESSPRFLSLFPSPSSFFFPGPL